MGMMINRRRMYGGKSPDILDGYTLIHDWESVDYSDGNMYWTDRVGGISIKKEGAPVKQGDYVKMNSYNYFRRELNTWANFGRDFKIVSEFMYEQPSANGIYVFDFGSVGQATHAFCLGMVSSNKVTNNPKFQGNNSGPTYEIPSGNRIILTPNTHTTVITGLVPISDTHSILFNTYNGETVYGANSYSGTFDKNFNINELNIGRAWHASVATNKYVYVKSIKIYKK